MHVYDPWPFASWFTWKELAVLIFLGHSGDRISLGGPSEKSLWLGMRGRGLSLNPLWSSGWSFLACLLLKVQRPLCRTWWGQGLLTHELTETEKGLSQYLPVDFFHVTINGRSLFPCGLQMSDHLDALGELQTLIKYIKLRKKRILMWCEGFGGDKPPGKYK